MNKTLNDLKDDVEYIKNRIDQDNAEISKLKTENIKIISRLNGRVDTHNSILSMFEMRVETLTKEIDERDRR